MRIYKTFMRHLVNYPWIGPDVTVVVIKMGRFIFINSNYEIRPDRLLEYKPEVRRCGSGWLPHWMQLPKIYVDPVSETKENTLFVWDYGLDYLENLKNNSLSQKEFDLMINNYPDFNKMEEREQLAQLWENVYFYYTTTDKYFSGLCALLKHMYLDVHQLDKNESYKLHDDLKWCELNMKERYNIKVGTFHYYWVAYEKEVRKWFIQERIKDLRGICTESNP